MTPDPVLGGATVALAVATGLLVLVGGIAALVALKQLKSANAAVLAANAAAVADHLRRRGEATMAAFARFETIYSEEHKKLIAMARKEDKNLKDFLASGPKGDAESALQSQLDALEILGLGARTRIFDVNVIYEAGRSVISQLWSRSTSYRTELMNGRLDTRPAQPSAYEHGKWLIDEMDKKTTGGPVQLDGAMPPID